MTFPGNIKQPDARWTINFVYTSRGEFQSQPEYLVVNIWDYDPAWTVQYYEDGIERSTGSF